MTTLIAQELNSESLHRFHADFRRALLMHRKASLNLFFRLQFPMAESPLYEAELLRSVYDKKHDLETMLLNHILLRLRNVVITTHSAFNTREAVERILSTSVGNIASFIQSEPEIVISGKRA